MSVVENVFLKIEEQWDEQVDFLRKLGRYPSTLGNEGAIQRFLAKNFEEMGLETDAFIPDPQKIATLPGYSPVEWTYDGRPVVVAKWANNGHKIGKSLILQGHIDVVSPEPLRFWDYDPWGSTIEGDRMYGRGICDMKSGVAAMIYAVKAIKDCGIELGADVLLETVHEEECTGNGALASLAEGYLADGVLIPEPFGPTGLVAQVGVIWVRVRVTGSGAHARSAKESANAIEKACFLIEALKKYEDKINQEPKHPAFTDMEHPLNVCIGIIKSGDWPSNVPAECTFEFRVGLYPDRDPQEIKDEVKAWLLDAAAKDPWLSRTPPEITFYGFHADGWAVDKEMEIFKVLENAHKKVFNSDMEYISTKGLTDTRLYSLYYDIPATCYGPLGDNLHAANEWVDLPSVKDCAKTYAAFILDWCGVRK